MTARIPISAAARLLLPLVLTATLVACGGGTTEPEQDDAAPPAAEDNVVGVDLQEWAVVPDQSTAPAGDVTFQLQNVGEETHEFVVVATDLDHRDLPTVEDGSVDEEGEGIEPVDEIEDIPSGGSEDLDVVLETGSYVLICNIVEEEDDGELESHYQMGMSVSFTVE